MKHKSFLLILSIFLISTSQLKANDRTSNEINYLKNEISKLNLKLAELNKQQDETRNLYKTFSDITFNGRIIFETIFHNNKILNKDDKTSTNIELKKARLDFKKRLFEDTFVNLTLVYNNKDFKISNAFIETDFNCDSKLLFGSINTIYNLEQEKSEIHSSSILPKFGRNYRDFLPSNGLGIVYKQMLNKLVIHFGAFGNAIDDLSDEKNKAFFAIRSFFVPINSNNTMLQMGINKSNVINSIKNSKIITKDHNSKSYFVQFNIKEADVYGAELSFKKNAFTLETEYTYLKYKPIIQTLKNNWYKTNKYYIEMTYMLTQETKKYNKLDGVLGRAVVNNPINEGGHGAFELVTRYTYLNGGDYNKNKFLDIGKHNIYTIGLNWIPLNYSKILLSYSKIKSKYNIAAKRNGEEVKLTYRVFF